MNRLVVVRRTHRARDLVSIGLPMAGIDHRIRSAFCTWSDDAIPPRHHRLRRLVLINLIVVSGGCDTLDPMEDTSGIMVVPETTGSGGGSSSGPMSSAAGSSEATDASSDALLCLQHWGPIQTGVSDAVVRARTGCASDDDCVIVPGPLACTRNCPVAIDRRHQAQFEADLALVMQGDCATLPETCEESALVPCVVERAECWSEGTCATVCDQPDWPNPDDPGSPPTNIEGQYVREGGYCGQTTCPAVPSDGPRSEYALSCCTDDGACGVFAWPLGPDCFERQPRTARSEQCPAVWLNLFADYGDGLTVLDTLPGCCRADGVCGVDTSETWGAGCVARSAIAHAAERTCNQGNSELATLEDIPCEYTP